MSEDHPADPIEELMHWIPEHPESWGDAVPELTGAEVDRLVTDIVSGDLSARIAAAGSRSTRSQRRRGRLSLGVTAGVLLVVTGAFGAAALFGRGQPTRPNELVACRAAADLSSDGVLINAPRAPVAGCAEVWESGDFQRYRGTDPVPDLVACVSTTGVIEVVPGDPNTCAALGLSIADPVLSAENEAIVVLQERVVAEINAADCAELADVTAHAQQILDEADMGEWSIVVDPNTESSTCIKVSVDAPTRTLRLIGLPPIEQPSHEED